MHNSNHSEVLAMAGVTGGHNVFSVEDLLGEFRHSEGPIMLASMPG